MDSPDVKHFNIEGRQVVVVQLPEVMEVEPDWLREYLEHTMAAIMREIPAAGRPHPMFAWTCPDGTFLLTEPSWQPMAHAVMVACETAKAMAPSAIGFAATFMVGEPIPITDMDSIAEATAQQEIEVELLGASPGKPTVVVLWAVPGDLEVRKRTADLIHNEDGTMSLGPWQDLPGGETIGVVTDLILSALQ